VVDRVLVLRVADLDHEDLGGFEDAGAAPGGRAQAGDLVAVALAVPDVLVASLDVQALAVRAGNGDACVAVVKLGELTFRGHVELHVAGSDWYAQFHLGPKSGAEIEATAGDLTVLMDLASAQRARGAKIDWVETVQGEGLKLDLPGAPPPVKEMTPDELQQRLNAAERVVVVDTRNELDRQQNALEFARPLDSGLMAELKDADRNTPLVFVCNKGLSSQEVAEHYRKQGFTEVYNLAGGAERLLG